MDIDPKDQLKVFLSFKEHGLIWYDITLNDKPVFEKQYETSLSLFDDIRLKVKITVNDHNQAALEIKNFKINEKEILPRYQHMASENTSWIRKGEWNFYIPAPFYTWHHTVSGQGWIA